MFLSPARGRGSGGGGQGGGASPPTPSPPRGRGGRGEGLINRKGSLSERTPKNGSAPTSGPLRRMGRTAGGPGAPRKQRVFLPPLNLRGRRMATVINTSKRVC